MPSFMSHPLSAHKDRELSAIAREIDGLRMSGFQTSTVQASAYSGTPNAASSAAVIHALRALQDKVHKLELEREQAGAQCGQLQQELDSYKTETEREKAESEWKGRRQEEGGRNGGGRRRGGRKRRSKEEE